ncbi:hypothetical protein DVW12_17090 [Clostridium botulinum]|nr:hypothetical protein [Clostridium botulinum]
MMEELGTSSYELNMLLPIQNTSWQQNSNGWWYKEGNSWAVGWRFIYNQWYYFYSNGYMAHDVIIIDTNDTHSYLNSSGKMVQSKTLDHRQAISSIMSANGAEYSENYIVDTKVRTIDEWNKVNNISTTASSNKIDNSKVLSSGLTLKEAKASIDAKIGIFKSLGETVEENIDYINKLCKSMGTTYDEIKSYKG